MLKKLTSAVFLAFLGFSALHAETKIAATPTGKGVPKYVFMFIGDGMSYPQIQIPWATTMTAKMVNGLSAIMFAKELKLCLASKCLAQMVQTQMVVLFSQITSSVASKLLTKKQSEEINLVTSRNTTFTELTNL